ncbi:MAG: gliding motility-associated protein GldL [Sphingobacteriales bacterium]|jgi:gliding motility-associated protein GldL
MKPGSKGWKKIMAKLYGIGAAVVIIGALFKIQHWAGASEMLILGLSVEALIFIFSAFEPIPVDYHWELVYPQFNPGNEDEDDHHRPAPESITQKLDHMLEDANIDNALLEHLGSGMRTLGDQAAKLSEITDAGVATNEYTTNLRDAAVSVANLKDTYQQASESLTGLSTAGEMGQTAGESLRQMTKNLNALNEIYELQLTETTNSIQASNQLVRNIQGMMEDLNASVDSAKEYRHNIEELATNLNQLNSIYGNMLAAMNVNKA